MAAPPPERTPLIPEPTRDKAAPPVLVGEPRRKPLAPGPATNQNSRLATPNGALPRPPIRIRQVIAWILILPWYVAVAASAIALVFLFLKLMLGL